MARFFAVLACLLLCCAPAQAFVVIDPGHGGIDGGAKGGGLLEKDLALAFGLVLRQALTDLGLEVRMTRETDTDLGGAGKGRHARDLKARVELAKQGEVTISIHLNTVNDRKTRGTLLFHQAGSAEGERLAKLVHEALAADPEVKLHSSKPVGRNNLYVLKHNPKPAILIELGFLTNAEDRRLLSDPLYQQRLALIIAGAVVRYLEEATLPVYVEGAAVIPRAALGIH